MKPYGVKQKDAISGKKDGVFRGLPKTNTYRKAIVRWKNCQKGKAREEGKRIIRTSEEE